MHPNTIHFGQTNNIRPARISVLNIQREPASCFPAKVNRIHRHRGGRRRSTRERISAITKRARPGHAHATRRKRRIPRTTNPRIDHQTLDRRNPRPIGSRRHTSISIHANIGIRIRTRSNRSRGQVNIRARGPGIIDRRKSRLTARQALHPVGPAPS